MVLAILMGKACVFFFPVLSLSISLILSMPFSDIVHHDYKNVLYSIKFKVMCIPALDLYTTVLRLVCFD